MQVLYQDAATLWCRSTVGLNSVGVLPLPILVFAGCTYIGKYIQQINAFCTFADVVLLCYSNEKNEYDLFVFFFADHFDVISILINGVL